MATSTTYNRAFWNVMKGKEENNQNLSEGFDNAGAYVAPDEFREGFNTALAKENIFRRFATVINLSSAEGKIQAVSSTGTADWVEDGDPIPESADTFTQFLVKSYKLASLIKLNRSFVTDMNFNLEKYLMGDFAKRFGKAEENALLNGNGTTQPTGILTADADVTTADNSTISFDEIISLYFSLKDEYRNNAVFIMHDNTAMLLRTLKDTSGSYLWNSSDNTIFGKPVVTSPYMPTVSAGAKNIVFGDLSYYWLIERQPITIKKLSELYALQGQIGFSAYERLDGKLIQPDALKILQIKA
ncbi:MAG: phage major capsid protein [Clostridia bacterium]|nr:phage major capsid protein [Clostridia bacterium]